MNSFGRFLRDKRNQQVLGWLGGGLVVATTGLWVRLCLFLSFRSRDESVTARTQPTSRQTVVASR